MNNEEQFYLDVQSLIFEISRFKASQDIEESMARLEILKRRKEELASKAAELKIPFNFSDMYTATVEEGFDDVAWDSSSIDC